MISSAAKRTLSCFEIAAAATFMLVGVIVASFVGDEGLRSPENAFVGVACDSEAGGGCGRARRTELETELTDEITL